MFRRTLHTFGYAVAHLLFLGANTPQSVVRRLWLYRLVGVKIVETPRVDDAERTICPCPYRNLAANWVGKKWLCHDTRDRVDDDYVTHLRRHEVVAIVTD